MDRKRWFAVGLSLAFSVGAAACSSDGKGSAAPTYAGQHKSVMVEAGKAASLSLGAVKLDVPEGAVAANTEVSVDISAKLGRPDEQKIAIDVYDFGPNGTTFDKAVKLEFELTGVNVGNGKKAVVAWLEGGKWRSLPTTVSNGKARAETTHFTPFTVLILDDDALEFGGLCSEEFTPCGGDLIGTWDITGTCLTLGEDPFAGEDDLFEVCDVQPIPRFMIHIAGTVSFGADGSFMNEQTSSSSGGFLVSHACLDQIGAEGGETLSCEDIGAIPEGQDCLLGGGTEEPTTDITTGTFTTEGTTLNVMEDGYIDEGGGEQYCVRGDTLTVRIHEEEDGSVIQLTATRSSAAR
jgi:hypothetical protein